MKRRAFPEGSLLRAGVATITAIDLLSFFLFLGDARATALRQGFAVGVFADIVSRPPVRAVIVLAGLVAAFAFGRRPARLWQGLLALCALAALSTAHAELFGSPWRHLYYSGLCLMGWLLGMCASRFWGKVGDESYARIGAIAMLGAAYCNAGISKLVYGGVDWISGTAVQASVIGQDGLVADNLWSFYRSWAATTPAAATFFSVGTMALELAAPLMILGTWPRRVIATGLIAMHVNIYLLTTYILYWESTVLLVLFGWFADRPGDPETSQGPAAAPLTPRTFGSIATILSLWAALAIGNQARRYDRAIPAHANTADTSATAIITTPIATRHAIDRLGPFSRGQRLARNWIVDSLELSDNGLSVTFSNEKSRVEFELTCAPSEFTSPFDLDNLHIFYSSDQDYEALKALGTEVGMAVTQATQDNDACRSLSAWRAAAREDRAR